MTLSSTKAVIDLASCQHNLSIAKQAAADSKCIAIIKANAYGHGIVQIAKALTDADAFGVARIEEAITLREANISTPILLLEGVNSKEELELVYKYELEIVIHNQHQLNLMAQVEKPDPLMDENIIIKVTLKVDSGMHRLGFEPAEVDTALGQLKFGHATHYNIKLMTHLSNADDKEDDASLKQINIFYQSIEEYMDERKDVEVSIANSAGILGWPQSHAQWSRPGIMLYGVSPFINSTASVHNLKPVMTLSSRIISIKQVKQGEAIGYGGTYVCEKDMTVGIVAIGYGDGYPRGAKTGTPVLVNGQRCSLLGRVSMDMICVDLTEHSKANLNDEVILWGEGLPIEEIAECSETIGYELLCGITNRVEFIYKE